MRSTRFGRPSRARRTTKGVGGTANREHSLIREPTRAGLAVVKRAGRTGGRPAKLAEDLDVAKTLLANPDIVVSEVASHLGVSPATLFRYLPAARIAPHCEFCGGATRR